MLILCMTAGAIYANTLPMENASPKVKNLILKNHLGVVDTAYVKEKIGKGTRVSSKSILLDARPHKKYIVGHVPAALSLPDTKFSTYFDQVKDMDRAIELITYCGGWKCAKSPKLAKMLREKGFTNIKVYQAGFPAWKKAGNYSEVDLPLVKSALKKANSVIIDARPSKKYKLSHIATAINIPDTKMDSMLDRLPKDKTKRIIAYCGGYKCAKSHNVAKKLQKIGYKNIFVYAGGMPEWAKAGLPIEGKKAAKAEKKSDKPYVVRNGVQLVKDQKENQNMVYGPWYLDLIKAVPAEYQLVDIRDKESYQAGHIPGTINIPFEDKDPKVFINELTAVGKKVIMSCASGAIATEAIMAVIDHGGDLNRLFYVDANVDCDKNNKCIIEINDPL